MYQKHYCSGKMTLEIQMNWVTTDGCQNQFVTYSLRITTVPILFVEPQWICKAVFFHFATLVTLTLVFVETPISGWIKVKVTGCLQIFTRVIYHLDIGYVKCFLIDFNWFTSKSKSVGFCVLLQTTMIYYYSLLSKYNSLNLSKGFSFLATVPPLKHLCLGMFHRSFLLSSQ